MTIIRSMKLLPNEIYIPRVINIRYIDVGGYRHDFKGFCQKFTFLIDYK